MSELTILSAYERAIAALAEAKSIDVVMTIRNDGELLQVLARQAGNRDMIADAVEIQIRAERALGELLVKARAAGQIATGRPRVTNGSETEPFSRVTLKQAGIDKKLSMRAQQLAAAPADMFATMLDRARGKIVAGGAVVLNPMKDLNTAEKKVKRDDREAQLARKIMALPDRKYGLIYADPEWRFEPYSRETGMDRAPDNHYPTSDLADIQARDVAGIAADHSVLALWVPAPMLPQGLGTMAAWGFTYVSHIVWRKLYPGNQTGTGYWFRNVHELLLIGVRGDVPAPAMGDQWASVKPAPVGAHSEKPDIFRQMLEQYFPNLPRIELNARRAVRGWDRWGYEAPDADTSTLPVDVGQPVAGDSLTPATVRHTRQTAEPIMREHYATAGAKGLVTLLGRPEGTISRWAVELGLADRGRLASNAAHARSHVQEKAP